MKKNIFLFIIIIFTLVCRLNSELFDRIFIVINNDVITINDFSKKFNDLREGLKKIRQPLPDDARQVVFNNLINEKIITQVAEKKEIFVSDMEINDAIDEIKTMNRLSDASFLEALKKEGKTLKELKEEYKKQLLNKKIVNLELRPKISPSTEKEIKDYYQGNPKEMFSPPKIRISHILIRDNPNASLSARSKIKKQANEILNRALSGENFDKLVKKYSEDDVSKTKEGDIGFITKGEWLGPQIDEILFKLKKNSVAPQPLPSPWGYHIVKVTDKKSKQKIPFEDMRIHIENHLAQKKMKTEYDKWIEEQKQLAYFEVIFPNDEKYIYDYNKWNKKSGNKVISIKEFYQKLQQIKIN